MKSLLQPIKPSVEKALKNGVIYKIVCPRCDACYVGMTNRHIITRYKEHMIKSMPAGSHLNKCNAKVLIENVFILASSSNQKQLSILEALFIKDIKPTLNTKDEYKRHTLTIKI